MWAVVYAISKPIIKPNKIGQGCSPCPTEKKNAVISRCLHALVSIPQTTLTHNINHSPITAQCA
jgi:hypothetical protein